MNFLKPLALLLFLLSITTSAQTPETDSDKLSLNSGTIKNQFDYVITKSNGWNDVKGQKYKVIPINWLSDLKTHVIDSLQTAKKDVANTAVLVKAQTQEIASLKTELTTTQQALTNAKNEKDTMSFMGIAIEKNTYRTIMWCAIVILLALLLFFIYQFKNSNAVTKNAKQLLTEVENEFEEHRKIAVEREQKVRRQLQDEINRQRSIKTNK